MANQARKATKKKSFTECEIEALDTEVEARRNISFGGLISGVSKMIEWQNDTNAVHVAGS